MLWVVVAGPMNYRLEMQGAMRGYPNVVYSTWKDDIDVPLLTHAVLSEPFKDTHKGNFNRQRVTSLAGAEYAADRGASFILKIRSDMIPTNFLKFISLLDFSKPNYLSYHNHDGGYLVDYVVGAPTNLYFDLWNTAGKPQDTFTEALLMRQYKEVQVKNPGMTCNMMLGGLVHRDNDLHWIKNNLFISSYKTDPLFQYTKPV